MANEISVLAIAAASIAFFHTLFGPDHYLPFIVMSRSGNWSRRKTAWITFLCGCGHVLGSILLGIFGVALGIAITSLESVEAFRGNLAAWALIAFGLVYCVWGVRQAVRNKSHRHCHAHEDGSRHNHVHIHSNGHLHVHEEKTNKSMTSWILFTIFVFGPCEPLIPLLMYPAAKSSVPGLILVTTIFSIVTILTMLGIVLIVSSGINLVPITKLERYTHAIAGATIFLCGMSIQFMGL